MVSVDWVVGRRRLARCLYGVRVRELPGWACRLRLASEELVDATLASVSNQGI